ALLHLTMHWPRNGRERKMPARDDCERDDRETARQIASLDRLIEERRKKNDEAAAWGRGFEAGRYSRLQSVGKRAGRVGKASFGPGRGNAITVTIFHDLTARTLTVLDNGRGMDAIGRLFQHGNSIGHSIGDIGEYGAGGTKALL